MNKWTDKFIGNYIEIYADNIYNNRVDQLANEAMDALK